MAIVSGRRAVRPDGGHYRHMRRQRLGGGDGRRRRRSAQTLMAACVVLLVLAGTGYLLWRFRFSH